MLAVLSIGIFLLIDRRKKKNLDDIASDIEPSIVDIVKDKVSNAVADVRVERAIIDTKSEARREELRSIQKETDVEKKRARLADMLQRSL